MFWKKKKSHKEIDTSKEGFEYIGVKLTDEQYSDLVFINNMFLFDSIDQTERYPVFYIILVLKALGLLKTEVPYNESGNNGNNNSTDDLNKEFERKFGRIIDRS